MVKNKEREGGVNSEENVLRSLTPRQAEVLGLIAQGFSNDTIAEKLCLQVETVDDYITRIFSKLEISSAREFKPRIKSVLLYQGNTPGSNSPPSYFEDHEREIVSLTPRQKEVVKLIGKAYSNQTIADTLGLAVKSVENYINCVLNTKIPVDRKRYNPRVVLALMAQTEHVAQ